MDKTMLQTHKGVETDGTLKPIKGRNIIFDMHTHSKNSHDSECDVFDMAYEQIKKGISGFAVTDHCDIEYSDTIDVNAICKNSVNDAIRADKQTDIKVLHGVEIGEAFWNKDVTNDILKNYKFDVVIGSVHAVRYKNFEMPYSQIDFSKWDKPSINNYMKQYFEDVLYMAQNCDFDILAHLTCPLRYINGKYNMGVALESFENQITKILEIIIKNKTALEINTSCVYEGSGYCEFLPNESIIKKYKDMGGYLITTGSDAHISKNASNEFDKLYKMLKNIGFKNAYYYENRCAIEYLID